MIVLDTHIWIELVVRDFSSWSVSQRLVVSQSDLWIVSPISCWEIGMLVRRRRLQLNQAPTSWINDAFLSPKFRLEPITPNIAVAAGMYSSDNLHGDPADRLIISTAQALKCPLVTRDQKIINAQLTPTIA